MVGLTRADTVQCLSGAQQPLVIFFILEYPLTSPLQSTVTQVREGNKVSGCKLACKPQGALLELRVTSGTYTRKQKLEHTSSQTAKTRKHA